METKTIGAEIRKLREKSGLSVNELGRRSGVSSAAISRIENEERKNPTVNVLKKISKSLNIDVSYLMSFNNTDKHEDVTFIELNPKERELIREIKKHRGFFEYLVEDTKGNVDRMHRIWKIMNEK